jgi:hypothetical protein
MALPRSSAQAAQAPSAVANFTFANVTFASVPLNSTSVTTLALPRSFKPQKGVYVVPSAAFQAGITMGTPYVTGNTPSYILNIPFSNNTAGALVPTSQAIRVVQD